MSLLPWQHGLAERIGALIHSGTLPHGILVTAPEGWGEVAFAGWLALTLLEVPQTRAASELAHPDLRWVKPDGAEIKVDAVREIGLFAFKTSQRGARKVVVLEDAHLLNRNAANALLKTLEEPPEDTYVVLATAHPARLLPTIRSRAQRFNVQPDVKSARAWLIEQWDAEDVEERLLGNAGAPMLVAAELAEGKAPLSRTLGAIRASRQPLDYLDELLAWDADRLTGGWYRHARAMLAGDGDVPARELLGFADELLWVRHQLLNTNSANARLLLGRLIVKWHGLSGPDS